MHTEELFDATWLALSNPPNPESEERVKKAREFVKTADAEDGVDYDWVYDYAKDVYSQKMATRDSHDEKADGIIKYLGSGTGLFTLAAIINVKPENRMILAWAVPSFLCILTSIGFAMLARRPNPISVPPTGEEVKRYADHFKTERRTKAAFIAQWHLAAESLRAANEVAASRVEVAIQWTFAAIVLLLLPVLAVFFC